MNSQGTDKPKSKRMAKRTKLMTKATEKSVEFPICVNNAAINTFVQKTREYFQFFWVHTQDGNSIFSCLKIAILFFIDIPVYILINNE